MASKEHLLIWYKRNVSITRLSLIVESGQLNRFWLIWEKNKLFIKRLNTFK